MPIYKLDLVSPAFWRYPPVERADAEPASAGDRLAVFVGQDFDVSEPRGVVDHDVHELPARAVGTVTSSPRTLTGAS
jgi:hypothetical protein